MASLTFPQLYPADEELTLVDDTTSVFQSAFGAGLTQRVTRIGPRWRLKMSFDRLSQEQRHNLMGFLSALQGRANAFMYWPRHLTLRGSFPVTELLPNTFDDVDDWAGAGQLGLYADGNRLRLTRTAVSSNSFAYPAQLTVTLNAAYLFRGNMVKGKGDASWALRAGSSAGSNSHFDTGLYAVPGVSHASGAIPATTTYASIYDYFGGRSIGDYQIFDGLSFTRCIRVNGASQTGSGVNVKNLPTSTNGLLLPGDIVSIYTTQWELKRVTQSLNSDSGGLGYLQFESMLRGSPADSAPVCVYRPWAKFILADDPKIKTRPGMYSDVDMDLIEVIEP